MLSSSPPLPQGHSSVRSSCGSETAEVLLHSTRVFLPDRSRASKSDHRSVHISVQKLADSTGVRPNRAESEPSRQKQSHLRGSPEVEPKPDEDLLTSRFTAGGRGVVLGALRRRSHSAPSRKEVRVQLLDSRTPQTSKPPQKVSQSDHGAPGEVGVQTEAWPPPERRGDVAAAAPPVKGQSDLEARVSQLLEDIHNLLDSHRQDGGMGRSLNQQTLQHLDALQQQQLRLQGQLLESALKIVTGHAPVTSDVTPSARPQSLQVTEVDAVCSRQHGRLPVITAAAGTAPVTMETRHRDCRHQLSRVGDGRRLQSDPSVSGEEAPDLQALAGQSLEAARRAQDMLKEMQQLKTEMKMLLAQPQEPSELTRSEPENLLVQHNQPQSKEKTRQNLPHQNQPHQNLPHQNLPHPPQQQSQPPHFQPDQSLSSGLQHLQSNHNHSRQPQLNQAAPQQNHPPYHQSLFHHAPPQEDQTHQTQSERPQKRPVVLSKLEEAGRVLRQTQRQKRVLEENLEVLLKARTGEILHCQLQALTANRDYTEEVRIKKAVDAWISVLNRDIQTRGSPPAQRSAEDAGRSAASKVPHSRAAGRPKPVSMLRGAERKPGMTFRTTQGNAFKNKDAPGESANRVPKGGRKLQEAEPIKVTNKMTTKQQLESDAETFLARLYGKVPHEGLRRTLKKSPYPRFSSPASPLSRRPRPRLVESVRGVKLKSCKTQTSYAPPQLLAPPIEVPPLQPQPRYPFSPSHFSPPDLAHSVSPAESAPVAMAVPLDRPRINSRAEIAQEMTSLPADPASTGVVTVGTRAPDPQKQHTEAVKAPPTSSVDIFEVQSLKEEEEEEEAVPPDNHQEEGSGLTEEALVLDGGPSPTPVLYHGPAFPPAAPSSPAAQDPAVSQQQVSLEARLMEWVEQQLMSRIISELYRPPPPDPVHSYISDQSELEERSLASDIVEAAGGEGLQLFVDTNTPVDSGLIRQLVSEVLTETIAQMFGQREAPEPEPQPEEEPLKAGGAADSEVKVVPLVPTPVLTPEPSMNQSSKEPSPVTTPPPSQPPSPVSQAPPQPIPVAEPVATPTNSPEPRLSEQTPPDDNRAPHPLPWGDPELPLDEEKPEEVMMENKRQLIMSVAEEEPPLCSPFPPSAPPPPLSPAPSPPAGTPSGSSEEPTGSSSSSSTVTAETEAALKHISEGELLISINQQQQQQQLLTADDSVCSLSSSLLELQDMEFDPLTFEEVRGGDLLPLTCQAGSHRGLQLEEEEMSLGEVRDYETPGQPANTALQENIHEQIDRAADQEEPGDTERDVHESSIRPQRELTADSDSSTGDIF
ncbi:protein TALPID3 isoform X2 [Oryzias latipes]|uniref:Protein TALPID3 n=1 Tax=Oryzias latipes TaxID=8090 RepID=A0A3B3HLJ1_ORYLA|nr:protein TALPID3 isoform X2 [Oryzias latipes]